jgi:hypothetical protein
MLSTLDKIDLPKVKRCPGPHHPNSITETSPYLRDDVPEKYFFKDPEDENSGFCKYCYFCRLKSRASTCKARAKRNEESKIQKEQVAQGKSNLMYCKHSYHPAASRNNLPMELFLRDKTNPNSGFHDTCSNCRKAATEYCTEWGHRIVDEKAKEGKVLCASCRTDITGNQHLNLDGTVSKSCQNCTDRSKNDKIRLRELHRQIKIERIRHEQMSCVCCQCLIFKPASEHSLIPQIVQTYVKDSNVRYCKIGEKEFTVENALNIAGSLLELRVIHFDHLTMQEQIQRGIIKNESEYSPKKGVVLLMTRSKSMRAEARKCQILCCYCHLKMTIARAHIERNGIEYIRPMSDLTRRKYNYVNSLKSCGCSSCGFKDVNLMPFFDMDHVHSKAGEIAFMMADNNVSFETFVHECNKCRVLCKFCHSVRTRKQIEEAVKSRLESKGVNVEFDLIIDSFIDSLEAQNDAQEENSDQ